MYAPSKPGDQPSTEVSKEFMMSPNKLHLECSLDKEMYYHGETISINVHIQVNSLVGKKSFKIHFSINKESVQMHCPNYFISLLVVKRPYNIKVIAFLLALEIGAESSRKG